MGIEEDTVFDETDVTGTGVITVGTVVTEDKVIGV
jgi:hypothetical protein